MKKEIVDLYTKQIGDGKSHNEAFLEVMKEFGEDNEDMIFKSIETAQKVLKFQEKQKENEREQAKKAELETHVDKLVEKRLDEELSKIKTKGFFEPEYKSVQVEDNWKEEAGEYLALYISKKIGGGMTPKNEEQFNALSEKNINRIKSYRHSGQYSQKAIDAIIARTDSAGGFFMPPQFDAEIDKLVYSRSEFLDTIKIRQGDEKTLINSVGTFDFAFRANENTAYSETRMSFSQQDVRYKDAGAMVPISRAALNGSYYNLIEQVMENAADARIRLLEPLLLTGSINVNNDVFNGLRFQTGTTIMNCKNNGNAGGQGNLVSSDLVMADLAVPAQSSDETCVFIMGREELALLRSEKDLNGRPLETVQMTNGVLVHKDTGRRIIKVTTLPRTLNGQIDRTTGTDVAVILGPLDRYRIYQNGLMRVDDSYDFHFDYDALTIRFVFAIKTGIPINSRSSFVNVLGVKSNAIQ